MEITSLLAVNAELKKKKKSLGTSNVYQPLSLSSGKFLRLDMSWIRVGKEG